ncbi:phosphoglycerate mutase [Nitrospira sp. KM1]|uniref:histidine phosphatase family protein n=1 Tax=Nitrospira sp. KM1 TaxID=1936990 RepID=UPI0013A7A947|nr:histidine phosphatase family protein [Nitrospira sp. KM1]BCA56983.1 phosphoglycerate mutase [Nitrospira sp. KM1]
MKQKLPHVYLIRHGETEWSRTRKHTGRTDIPLTTRGEEQAIEVGRRLAKQRVQLVYTSPLQRALRTAELSGFLPPVRETDPNLMEWDYGEYEGRLTSDIRADKPGWDLFRDGCPGGESLKDVSLRADRIVSRLRKAPDSIAIFSHAHFLRVFAARWVELDPTCAKAFILNAGAICVLGYEHESLDEPVILRWNLECEANP